MKLMLKVFVTSLLISSPLLAKESQTMKKAKQARSEELRGLAPKNEVSAVDAARAQKVRVKAINSILKVLKSTSEPGRQYELLRRLGELYAEQSEFRLGREIVDFESAFQKWEKGGKKGKAPVADYSRSTNSLKSAVAVYETIVTKFAKGSAVDVTYYELGKLLLRLNDPKGVTYLTRLVKEHPKSELVPETYLALGEYYFDKHEILTARDYYLKAARFNTHTIYPYTVFKLGWAYYNSPAKDDADDMKNKKLAISAFKLVVSLSTRRHASPNQIYLRQEAINDLIMVWAETEDIESAWTYFRSIDSQDSFYVMLEKLGSIYIEQGQNEKAIIVYLRILKESPYRPTNIDNHSKLVSLYDETSKIKLVQFHLKKMAEQYASRSPWYEQNRQDTVLLKNAEETVEKTIHRYGSLYHKRAQKGNQKPLFEVAANIYALYLTYFPTNPKSYELRYFLADCLFEVDKYELAAEQYNKVVNLNEKNGKYLHDAAMNSVIAMNKVVSTATFSQLPPPGQVPSPLPLPGPKTKLLFSLDQYVRLFAKKSEALAMKVSGAELQYVHGHYEDAISRYERIIKEHVGTAESDGAVKVILSHFKERKDWDKVIAYTTSFIGAKNLLKGKLLESTRQLLVQASFNRALAYEVLKNYEAAAASFENFQKAFPKEENAPRALYNAMINYYRVPDVAKAIVAGKKVVETYPKFDRNPDIVATIADTYEGLADFASAASYYEFFAKSWPNDKRSANSLYNAAILFKGIKSNDKAIKALTLWVARYPKNPLSRDANLELAELLSLAKRNGEAVAIYNELALRYGKVDPDLGMLTRTKAIELGADGQDIGKLFQAMTPIRKEMLRKDAPPAPEARKIVAGVSLDMIDSRLKEFTGYTSKDQQGDITKIIQAKQQKLVDMAVIYGEIISIGSADHVVASLYKLGEAHEAFAQFIVTFPEPKDYLPADKEVFQKSLNRAAEPLRTQAYKYYESAFNRSFEYQVFSEWGKRSYDKIAQINPKDYPRIREFQVEPGYTSHSLGYDEGVATSLQ